MSNNINNSAITYNDIQKINCAKHLHFKGGIDIENFLIKAQLLEAKVYRLKPDILIMEQGDNIHILSRTPRVIIENGKKLFYNTKFKSIDMTNTNTYYMRDASSMFDFAKAKKLNLSDMRTDMTLNMEHMFGHIELDELDLSSFDTRIVKKMNCMFLNSKIKKLNISNWKTPLLEDALAMFEGLKTESIDISHFDLSNLQSSSSAGDMFASVETNTVNIGKFNIVKSRVYSCNNMFWESDIENLIIDKDCKCTELFDLSEAYYIGNKKEIDKLIKRNNRKGFYL